MGTQVHVVRALLGGLPEYSCDMQQLQSQLNINGIEILLEILQKYIILGFLLTQRVSTIQKNVTSFRTFVQIIKKFAPTDVSWAREHGFQSGAHLQIGCPCTGQSLHTQSQLPCVICFINDLKIVAVALQVPNCSSLAQKAKNHLQVTQQKDAYLRFKLVWDPDDTNLLLCFRYLI